MPVRPRPRPRAAAVGAAATALVLALLPSAAGAAAEPAVGASPAAPPAVAGPAARPPVVFGVAAATRAQVEAHERVLGESVEGVRMYRTWGRGGVIGPQQRWARDAGHSVFLSIRSERADGSPVRFADVAAARPGSALHADLVAMAREVKAYGAPIGITYHHEPEAAASTRLGDGPEFAAAWRRVVSVFRAEGVTNARFIWTTTLYGFERTDARAAARYYPGDDVVDAIAGDGYNWYDCRGGSTWKSFADVVEPLRRFGAAHPHEDLVLMEVSSVEDPRRPGRKGDFWRGAPALLASPGYGQLSAVLYYGGENHDPGHGCRWDYRTSSSSLAGWVAMARSDVFGGELR